MLFALLYPISVVLSFAAIFGADYIRDKRIWRSTVIWGSFVSFVPVVNVLIGFAMFETALKDRKNNGK